MFEVQTVRIGDLGRIVTGKTPPSSNPELFGKEYPFLTPTDMDYSSRFIESGRFLSVEGYEYQKGLIIPPGSICVVCIGATIGKVCMTRKPSFTNQQVNSIVVFQDKHDPVFVYYLLTTLPKELKANSGGAATPIINKSAFSEVEITIPLLPIQRRIASILSAYDELIENCQRRIRVLEAMARALYREWFVHFRFPGHENHPRVPSPLGEIPQGWEVVLFPASIEINPRVRVSKIDKNPFVPMGSLSNDSMLITAIESRSGNSGSKFQNGDTLFARITPCLENGKTGFVQFLENDSAVARGSTEFIVLRSRTLTPEFVYCLARSNEFRGVAIKSMTGASGRQRVQHQCFNDLEIVVPNRVFLDKFSKIVKPSFRLIYSLHQRIQNLRKTRDLVLPRLLSGQLQVEEG